VVGAVRRRKVSLARTGNGETRASRPFASIKYRRIHYSKLEPK
jgi:hypothetical protein